jgi:hypothetical protein
MAVETLVCSLFNHLTRLDAQKTYGVQSPRKLQIIRSIAEVTCHSLSVNKYRVSVDFFAFCVCMYNSFQNLVFVDTKGWDRKRYRRTSIAPLLILLQE